MIPTIGPYILPHLLPRLARDYDRLDLRLRETQTSQLVDEVVHGKIDVALIALPVDDKRLARQPLYTERVFYAVKRGAPEAVDAPLQARMASGEDLLLLEEGHCLSDQALSFRTRVRKQSPRADAFRTIGKLIADCAISQGADPLRKGTA